MKRRGAKRTSKIFKSIGATETVNSGASLADGDAILDIKHRIGWSRYNAITVESKVTDKKSFSLTLEMWNKLRVEASAKWNLALFLTDIQGESLVTLSLQDFMDILRRLEYLEDENEQRKSQGAKIS